MENLFLAVGLIDIVKTRMQSALESAAHLLDFKFRRVPMANVHLSVQCFGRHERMSDGLIKRTLLIGSRIEAPAFSATFDRLQGFNGRYGRAIVLTGRRAADGFLPLRRGIFGEMHLAGLEVPPSLDFAPHVSLAYQRTRIPTIPVKPVTWVVHELVLIRSFIGSSKHICLGRWPLWMPSAPPA